MNDPVFVGIADPGTVYDVVFSSLGGEPDRLVGYRERLRFHEDQAGRRDEQHGEAERGKHRPGERARRVRSPGVWVRITGLRPARRATMQALHRVSIVS